MRHFIVGLVVGIVVVMCSSARADAPAITLTADKTELAAAGQITLTWSTTGAKSCSADWTTSTAVSGSQAVSVTTARDYKITCKGTVPAIKLSWTAPTANTDGSAYSNPDGYYVYSGTSESTLTKLTDVTAESTLSYTVSSLAEGTYYFAVTAYNKNKVESAKSGVLSKTVVADTASKTLSVVFTIRPNPPTNLTATVQ